MPLSIAQLYHDDYPLIISFNACITISLVPRPSSYLTLLTAKYSLVPTNLPILRKCLHLIVFLQPGDTPPPPPPPPKVETPPSPQKSKQKGEKKSLDSDSGGSPLHRGPRRGVAAPLPPLMQQPKTQPDFVHELEKELRGRRNTEGKDTPPVPRVNGEGVGSESKTAHPAVRSDGEVTGNAASTPKEQPADEVDGGKVQGLTHKSKRALLSPRTMPAPLPPGAGEAGKGKGQPPPPVSSKPQAKGHMKQENWIG